jgi:prepilin-type N-terminal cleavage/methylation domain-containing protein
MPQFPPARRQRGFTLIELISVILIIAAMANFALPRLTDLSRDAHRAKVARTAGIFGSAIRMAFTACVVSDYAGRDNLPGFGAGNVDFNAYCLPASTNGNNGNFNAARCLQVWNGVLDPAPSISTAALDSTEYRAQGSGVTCTYTYRRDSVARRFVYNGSTGAVVITANP